MKLYIVFIIVIFSINVYAVGEGKEISNLKKSSSQFNWKMLKKEEAERKTASIKPIKRRYRGNLPPELIRKRGSRGSINTKNAIIYPTLAPINKSGIDIGDVFDCIIKQDIKAYVGSKSPIRAEVLSGPKRGLIFVGNAVMDPKTKNILIWFDLMRDLETKQKHKVLASIHSTTGEVGLVGTHHSRYWQHFFATVMSRAAEGYAQASVERNQNIFGNYQQVPSTENAGKAAVAEAASSTADIIADNMRNLPEFVTKKGPIRTKIFITETPKLTN